MHIASVSTAEGIDAIRQAKSKGLNLTCSVNIHHLLFDETAVSTYDTNFKVVPPLRTKNDQQALWAAIEDGTVDCLAVDHLPKDIEHKACEFDNASFGMAGFEGSLVHLLDTKKLDWPILQQVCSVNPRALLGLPELKIVEGGIAEFTILDKNESDLTGFASKAYNNPFKGTTTAHRVVGVYVNGKYLGN
jgi:dihydroorotase